MNLILSITNLPESIGMLYLGFGLVALAIILRRVLKAVQVSAERRVQDAPHTEQV